MADQVPPQSKVVPGLALPNVTQRPAGLSGKVRTAFALLRRGEFAGLADALGVFLRTRFARLVRGAAASSSIPWQQALQQIAGLRPASEVPSLADLRARVASFLPAAPGRVSVVVSCCDHGRLVVEAVDSLRQQTYPAVEIVVVDAAAADASTRVALGELEVAGDVRVVRQASRELVAARQAGAAVATGEFLLCLDADEWVTPEGVALLVAHLIARPDCAFAHPAQHCGGDEEVVREPQPCDAWSLLWPDQSRIGALVRRAAFEAIGGYDSRLAGAWADGELGMALAAAGHHGLLVPVPLLGHRRHGQRTDLAMQPGAAELRNLLLEKHAGSYAPAAMSRSKRRWRPSVSVVVPFHDAHRFWPETLASLRAQTLTDFEVVLVNDASTAAESLRLLDELRHGGEVRVIDHAQRAGAAAARNTGVLAARGEFVFLLDADDLLAPQALEQLTWWLLTSPDCGFVYSGVVNFGEQTGACFEAYEPLRLRHENYLTCAALLRREVYVQVGGMTTEADLHEDWDFWLRLASLGIQGRLLPEPLFYYRRHGRGRSATVRQQVSDKEMRARLRRRNPVLFGDASVHPAHYAPMPSAGSPLDELTEALRARYRQDLGCRYEIHRRPNVPNLVPEATWADERVHVLLLVSPRGRDDGAEAAAWLRSLDRQRCRLTVVATGAAAWIERVAPFVDEVFRIEHVVAQEQAALPFLEYVVCSRAVDLVVDAGAAIGLACRDLVARRYPQVRTVAGALPVATEVLATRGEGAERRARLRSILERTLQGSIL